MLGSWRARTAAVRGHHSTRRWPPNVADTQGGTTAEGIHLGAMAGTLDIIRRCYTGLEPRDGVLWLNPRLPTELGFIDLQLLYRQQWLSLRITDREVRISVPAYRASPDPHRRDRPAGRSPFRRNARRCPATQRARLGGGELRRPQKGRPPRPAARLERALLIRPRYSSRTCRARCETRPAPCTR
jgi:hypothetical protein